MVRNGLSLRQAANDLNIAVTSVDLENIQRRRSFQEQLRNERKRYYQELGSDPGVTKAALIGRLLILADKLYEQDDFDKSGEVLFKVAKIRGDVGADASVNVFGNLSARDYDQIRKSLEEGNEARPNTQAVVN